MSKVEYAIVVKNKTRLELLIERFNTKAQARFYIERSGGNYDDYETEHEVFHASLNRLLALLGKTLKYKVVERIYVPSFLFAPNQVIVVIGQDGLVANTAKYANGVPIVAVNPDKKRYDGVLLPFDVHNFVGAVEKVLTQTHRLKQVAFAEARLQDGQRLLAFNDLFIGAATHVSARYRITYNRQTEEHSSSGLIVSTKAGFTGWLSSVFNMAKGIGQFLEHEPRYSNSRNEAVVPQKTPTLSDEQLLFAVREPFKSLKTQTGIVAGIISHELGLTIESLMPANGVIFSDGIEADFLKFNSGAIAKIGVAPEKAALVLP